MIDLGRLVGQIPILSEFTKNNAISCSIQQKMPFILVTSFKNANNCAHLKMYGQKKLFVKHEKKF